MNEELIKELKGLAPWLLAAAIVVGGYYWVKNHRAERRLAATEAAVAAYTVDELETAAENFKGSATEGVIKLRLAKAYYDAGNYQAAYDIYAAGDQLPAAHADAAPVGCAQCLEAMEKFAEALAAFDAFVESNPDSELALTAKLGAIRSLVADGKKDAALERVAALKESVKDDAIAKMRVETTEDLVKRYVKPQPAMLPVAPAPVADLAVEPAPVAESVPATDPAPAPAPAADAAAKTE